MKVTAAVAQEHSVEKTDAHLAQAANLFSYAVLAGGIATIAVAAYLVMVSYSSLPAWDGWIEIHFGAERGTQSALAWLWNQHYEHRLLIPKLFLLADLYWFHAGQTFLLVSIFAIQALHLLLLGWIMRLLGGWRGALWRCGFGLAAFCLFCPSQWENLTWGFQTCFVLPGFFATLSFFGLLLYWTPKQSAKPSGGWGYLLLSMLAALGASYSLSNGNLVWPLLLLAALLLRTGRAALITVFLTGIASIALFLNGYVHPAGAANISVQTIPLLLKYFLTYFGTPWIQLTGGVFNLPPATIRAAEIIGILGLAILGTLLAKIRLYLRTPCPLCLQFALTALFCVGTGAVTALGRYFLGPGQAFASRYQTVSLLFWCSLGLLWLAGTVSSKSLIQTDLLLLTELGLLLVFVFAASRSGVTFAQSRVQAFKRNTAAAALLSDVHDMEQLRWADYQPDEVLTVVPYMREKRLSIFAGREFDLFGQPVNSALTIGSPKQCEGSIESSTTLPGGWTRALRITGWAWDSGRHKPPSQIILATNGVVNGIGAMGDWRPAGSNSNVTSHYVGFTAYARDVPQSSTVEVYAIPDSSANSACLIATLRPQ